MDTEPAQETFLARSDYLGATAEELGQKSACGPVIIQFRFTGPTLAVTFSEMLANHGLPVLLLYCMPLPPLSRNTSIRRAAQ